MVPEVELVGSFGFFGSKPELGATAPPSLLAAPLEPKKGVF
jgi:hypothetical protein